MRRILRLAFLAAFVVLLSEGMWESHAQSPAASGTQAEGEARAFAVRHRDAGELAEQVRAMLPGERSNGLFVSPRANELVFRGAAADMQLVAQLVAKLDQPLKPSETTPPQAAPTLEAYTIRPEQRQQMQQWAAALPAGPSQRAAWDQRTGQLIVFAPPAIHAEVQQKLATKPSGAQDSSSDSNTLKLRTLSPAALHSRLERLVSGPLPATWDAGERWLSFPVRLGEGQGVTLRIDSQQGVVKIEGLPADQAAWRQVVLAMDNANGDASQSTQLVKASQAKKPAIRRALATLNSATSSSDSSTQSGGQGRNRMVTMLFQPQRNGNNAAEQAPAEGDQQPDDANTPAAPSPEADTSDALLGPVQVEFVEGLDIIVLRGSDRDVARVMRIINEIEELSAVTAPEIEIHPLKHVASESIGRLLAEVYQQVLGPRTGTVSITPLGKPNSLLLIGRKENVQMAIDLANKLDQPVVGTTRYKVFPLRHASASDAKVLIDEFLARDEEANDQNPAGTAALSPQATVIADYRSNALVVSASPRELAEIGQLVEQIDIAKAAAVDEVRIFQLRNSLASDLAEVLRTAISQTGEQAAGEGAQEPRSASLRFVTIDRETRKRLESGIVTNVRIAADERANSLVITAPAESMELIAALIAQLDQSPDAEAELKVFTIANGDAVALVEMLRTLFNTEEDDPEAGGLGAASNSLVRLQFSVDERTNSIIAAGSEDDLAIVYAVLTRLDGADTRERVNKVFRLNNASSTEVADTINAWLDTRQDAEEAAELAISPYEQIDREVIVVAEPGSNSLIISATPRYYEEIRGIITQLDERPPMVMVQVLIAEVRLNDTDEFGVELGLQDSLLFDRSLVGDLTTINTSTQEQSPGGAILTTNTETIINSPLTPGFNFNNVNEPLGNNGSTAALATAANVATQSLVNFGVGRVNNSLGFGGFVLSASSNSVDMLLRALQENRRLEVLSRPQITMLDGQSGEINVGQRVPRIENVDITQFGQQNSIVYENVGIILNVTPLISPDGQVVMRIGAEKSELGSEAEGVPIFAGEGGAVVRAPIIEQTRAETTVMAASGQTIVLSGLLTKSTFDIHRRVPLLADIPLLGDLFRFDSVSEERTELLIIMTPRVIRSEADAEMLKQVESSRMSWVMCDVVTMHGPSGLRSRNDEWGDSETDAVYPCHVPSENEIPLQGQTPQEVLMPGGESIQGEMLPIESPPSQQHQWPADALPAPSTQAPSTNGVEPASFRSNRMPSSGPHAGASINRLPPVQ